MCFVGIVITEVCLIDMQTTEVCLIGLQVTCEVCLNLFEVSEKDMIYC